MKFSHIFAVTIITTILQAWMEGNPRLVNDKDALKYLTVDSFEKIIDILERHTGFAVDPIPQVRDFNTRDFCLTTSRIHCSLTPRESLSSGYSGLLM